MAESVSDLRRLAWKGLARLPRPVRELAYLPVRRTGDAQLRALTPMPAAQRRLYLGPWNTAGAARGWAQAAQEHLPNTAAQNLWAQRTSTQAHFAYAADHKLSIVAQRGHVRRIHGERVLREATHVIFESGRPVLANFHAGSMLEDVPALRAARIGYAVLYHGSDIRDLREHAERYPHSPFRQEWDDYFTTLQSIVEKNRAELADFDGTVFVPTPDLLDVLPDATWLPLVIDVDRFTTDAPALERSVPVVLHAPSNPRLKGTAVVEDVLSRMGEEGLVEYRQLSGVPHAQMPAFVADADIVVDQVVLGNPGVLMAESWAAGRLVVSHLPESVRSRMAQADPDGQAAPVVEADAGTLEEVLREIVADPSSFQDTAARGPAWARRHHDGRRSARVLADTLL
ncbi:MAG: hypothetical protein Q4P07_07980 [Ornithinimicrobium sp.]|uniref:hypothetical protein n=1 Tax=Ornithinimicrobium sp. TaxID=1977084 RepID=UPI0026DEACB7|nr:hypothetical protein [Ornithinimicrobium sp.]MDO5740072.1 hypothetical protein [Ornithinimicrobium sp.]